ncbi:hypothetical protein [Amycolatopsis rubida]|uniref:Uncharacterized protein n=1 Tax=Amycolatopsis rubida TaxID=112413 RepID=A0A1I6A497_9PSEU|nr:hypothetical protein [Amycolatopsis rubida]SFQ63529.1 hypothetical protein SAMN05421854_11792 [Amycolatopsis rubida]
MHARRRSVKELEQAWTSAYQAYAGLYNVEQRESTDEAREQLGLATEAVAHRWHELLEAQAWPWWVRAAVVLAVREFSRQAAELAASAAEPAVQATAERVRLTNPHRLPSSRPASGRGRRNGPGRGDA